MSNHRIHPYLTIDRKAIVYSSTAGTNIIREGMPFPADLQGKDYVTLPQNVLPTSPYAISLRVQVHRDGKQEIVREPTVYDTEFLQRFFNPAYDELGRLALLEEQYGRYQNKKTSEGFLNYLDQLVANANLLLGGKVDVQALWQSPEGRLLLDWIHQQKGYLAQPVAPRKAKSRAQILDTTTQLAVIYYLQKGGKLNLSLRPGELSVHLLAGLLARTTTSIEPLVRFLTEKPSLERNRILTEKYIRKAAEFFSEANLPELARLAEEDLVHLR